MNAPLLSSFRWAPAALAAALVLPACTTKWTVGDGSMLQVRDDHATLRMRDGSHRLRLDTEGEVRYADDESDVIALEPGGRFELRERREGVERGLLVRADADGTLSRRYELGGKESEWDSEAKAWLAATLQHVFRETGHEAGRRVERLLAVGGADAVLHEVGSIGSEFSRALHLAALLERGGLAAEPLGRALRMVEELNSDFEAKRVLMAALAAPDPSAESLVAVLRATRGFDSDFERGVVLKEAASRLPAAPAPREAWLEAARGFDSDFETARAIEEALAQAATDGAFAAELCALAGRQLDSDFELGRVLDATMRRAGDPSVAVAYLEACAAFDSDFELGQALRAIAGHAAADAGLELRYRELARKLGDYERGRALTALDDAKSR